MGIYARLAKLQNRNTAKPPSGCHPMTPRGPRPTKPATPRPLTWTEASWAMLPGGGLHFVMPVPEATNHATTHSRWGVRRTKASALNHRAAPLAFRHVPRYHGPCIALIAWVRVRTNGDTDGRLKQALDLLQGIAYADDKCVELASIFRVEDPTERARCEIIVLPAPRPYAMADLFTQYQAIVTTLRKAAA